MIVFRPPNIEENRMTRKTLIDALERLVWTAVAGALTALSAVQFDLGPTWTPLVAVVWTGLLVAVRKVVPALPDPGAGLPGLREPPA